MREFLSETRKGLASIEDALETDGSSTSPKWTIAEHRAMEVTTWEIKEILGMVGKIAGAFAGVFWLH